MKPFFVCMGCVWGEVELCALSLHFCFLFLDFFVLFLILLLHVPFFLFNVYCLSSLVYDIPKAITKK